MPLAYITIGLILGVYIGRLQRPTPHGLDRIDWRARARKRLAEMN